MATPSPPGDAFLCGKVTTCGRYTFSMRDCDYLGSGTHSEVFRGLDVSNDSAPVAIKVYKHGHTSTGEELTASRRMTPHPNVATVLVHTTWLDVHGKARDVIVEEVFDTDLFGVVEGHEGTMTESSAAYVMYQLLSGLAHVHAAGIVHHDVKLDNVYVNTFEARVALGDFDLATFHEPGLPEGPASLVPCIKRGTLNYLPPELRLGRRYDKVVFDGRKGDVWSCGVVLVHLLTRAGMEERDGRITYSEPQALDRISAECASFITACMSLDVDERWSAARLLNHEWMGCRKAGQFTFNKPRVVLPVRDGVVRHDPGPQPSSCGCWGGLLASFRRNGSMGGRTSFRKVYPPSAIGLKHSVPSNTIVPLAIPSYTGDRSNDANRSGTQPLTSKAHSNTTVSTPVRTVGGLDSPRMTMHSGGSGGGVIPIQPLSSSRSAHNRTQLTLVDVSESPTAKGMVSNTSAMFGNIAGNSSNDPTPRTRDNDALETLFS